MIWVEIETLNTTMDIYVVGPVKIRYFPLKRRQNTTGKDSFANEFEPNFKAKTIPLSES